MEPNLTLLQRAEGLLAGAALAALAAVPLAAQADVVSARDFVVEGAGAYFYNASGYFADWRGQPDGGPVASVNSDGSAKLYGTASADSGQFLAHNCSDAYGCSWYEDRGLTLVYWGRLRAPARAGDQIAMHYDFNVDLPDVGGNWRLSAALSSWDFGQSNTIAYGTAVEGWADAGGQYHLEGEFTSDAVQAWDIDPDQPMLYWQVALSAVANAPWDETYWSDRYGDYVTPFRGLSISVPDQSLDIALFNANDALPSPVPEPGSLALTLAALGALAARRRRR